MSEPLARWTEVRLVSRGGRDVGATSTRLYAATLVQPRDAPVPRLVLTRPAHVDRPGEQDRTARVVVAVDPTKVVVQGRRASGPRGSGIARLVRGGSGIASADRPRRRRGAAAAALQLV